MIALQWHERRHLKKRERTARKHLCTLLYAADLMTARQSEAIQRELFGLETTARTGFSRVTRQHGPRRLDPETDGSSPDIRALADELIRKGTMDDFHDRYARSSSPIQDDQMLKWPASDMAFVHEYRKKNNLN